MADVDRLQIVVKKIIDDRISDLDRLIRLSAQYYNLLDPDQLPTDSKIPFPFAFAMTEEQIPHVVEYLFPEVNAVRLWPEERDISIDNIMNAEWALHQTVSRRVPVKRQSAMAIMDCFKVGVGYTISEQGAYTPFASGLKTASDQKNSASVRVMKAGKERKSVSYRHLNCGQVLGHTDGSDTNGSKRSSTVIFLDFYTPSEVESMSEGLGDRRDASLLDQYGKFSAKEKDTLHESISSWNSKILSLNGPGWVDDGDKENLPSLIPVVKIYEEKKETWLSFGEDVVYENDGGYSTLRCPITKWSSVLDGDMWYPMSLAEAMEKPHLAQNIWVNMIYDAFTWVINRPMVYSKEEFPNGPPEYNPRERIGAATNDGRNAVSWLDGPNITADSFEIGTRLEQIGERITGKKDMAARNYTRGGAQAFQELMASTTGRQRMAGWIMQTGSLQNVYENILIEMQMMDEDLQFNVRDFDADGKENLSTRDITLDDLRRGYSVTLSLEDKYYAGSLSTQDRLIIYQQGKEDPYFDPQALRQFWLNNDEIARRLLKPDNQIKQVETQERNAQLLNRSLGVAGRLGGQEAPQEAPA